MVVLSTALALVILASPRVPAEAESDTVADASWSAVLGYAHQHGFHFGRDIVFTYGPLGFLATPFAIRESIELRLLSDCLLSLVAASGLVRLASRLGMILKWFFLGTCIFLLANISPRTDLLIELGVISWALLTLVEEGRILIFAAAIFVGVAVIAALVKITLFILAVLAIGGVGFDFLLRRKWRGAAGILGGFAMAFVLGWVGLGQSPLHLPGFIAKALVTSQGYNQAMGYEGSQELRWRGVFVALATAATVLLRTLWIFPGCLALIRWRRAALAAWLLAALFLVWKHGFVRTDLYHAGFFFGLTPILALGLEMLPTSNAAARLWARATAGLCWFVSVVTVQSMVLPNDLMASLIQPWHSIRENAERVLLPARHVRQMNEALAVQRDRSRLPELRNAVGQGSVDMFGYEQTHVLFNDLRYRPRPVFQSYAAYSPPLMQMNEDFYLSPSAPEYVLFRLMAMDRKFPPLEDSRTLRNLLINFEPAGNDGTFLLLKSRTNNKAQLRLITDGTLHSGQKLMLDGYGDADLWIEFSLQPSTLGRAQEFLYQPPKVRLALWYGDVDAPKTRRFRAPAPMLAAGFLISPLLLNNEDVLHLYEGRGFTRPHACAIEFNPGSDQLWKQEIPFRIYHIESKLGRCGSSVLNDTNTAGFGFPGGGTRNEEAN